LTLAPGAQIGPYKISSMLGQGGMGEVYRATDSRLGRDVAIKVLTAHRAEDPQSLRRFEQEAKSVAALAHPNILVLYDVGEHNGIRYAVTELLEGKSLLERLATGPLPWREAVEVCAAVAEGLAAAHTREIVHRDIKPANLFLTADLRVKILDFGLARSDSPTPGDSTVTEAGTIMGTIAYMSPEQVRGGPVTATSDIFSLGVVLYELVAGRRPFPGASSAEVMATILKEPPLPISDAGQPVPRELQRIVERCLAKDPAQRFASARDLAIALKSLTSSPVAAQSTRFGRRRMALAAVLLSIAATGFAYWRWKPGSQGIDSVAVLPFVNTSATPDAAYLSDGITESLISSLSQLPNLKVMSRSAVFRYQGKNADARTAGRELGVRAVLTGRVNQHADSLLVSAELVSVDDNSELWGEQYDNKQISDALAVQKDIARQIVEKLRGRLTAQQAAQIGSRQTNNAEAYQLYLKGRYYAAKFDPVNLSKGRDFLRQAIAADPNYALAYDGLSYYYALMLDLFEPANEAGPKALESARKALQLVPDLVEGHVELASAHMFFDFNWDAADQHFHRALELNPNYAPAHEYYGWRLIEMGNQNEGLAQIRKAAELDPLSAEIAFEEAWFLLLSRRYTDALTAANKCLELDPQQWMAYYIRGQAYEQLGRYPEALAALSKAEEILGANPSPALAEKARVYALSGQRDEARRALDRLLALGKSVQVSKYVIATVYAALGDKDHAFQNLDRAYEEHSFLLGFLKVDPAVDPLRADARFGVLLRKMKLQ
jgi:eukaryotic-like serine/threonine-protein kinase